MGFFFENLCVRDLRVYADSLDGTIYHYRDKNGLECDAVIHLRNGAYGLIEIKLGGDKAIEEGKVGVEEGGAASWAEKKVERNLEGEIKTRKKLKPVKLTKQQLEDALKKNLPPFMC